MENGESFKSFDENAQTALLEPAILGDEKSFYKDYRYVVWSTLGFSVLSFVLSFVLILFFGALGLTFTASQAFNPVGEVFSFICNVFPMFLTLYVFFYRNYKKRGFKPRDSFKVLHVGFKKAFLYCFLIVVFVLLFNDVVARLFYDLLTPVYSGDDMFENSTAVYTLLNCVLVTVISPIMEEYVFRGVILNVLKRANVNFAIVFSSILFAALHLSLFKFLPTLFAGILYGLLSVYTKSIVPSIIAHSLNNSLSLVLVSISSYKNDIMIGLGLSALIGAFILTLSLIKEKQKNFLFKNGQVSEQINKGEKVLSLEKPVALLVLKSPFTYILIAVLLALYFNVLSFVIFGFFK